MSLEIRAVDFDHHTARTLVFAQQFEIALMYDVDPATYAVLDAPGKPTSAEFDASQQGAFHVAYLNNRPIACGGMRRCAAEPRRTAEIKRMFTRPEGRQQGAARAVLSSLEDAACVFGYEAMVLETGLVQAGAIVLYEKMGYRRIAKYGKYAGDPLSLCYRKQLDVAAAVL